MARRKRGGRRRGNNPNQLKYILGSAALILCVIGGGIAAYASLGKRVADQYGCYDLPDQKQVAVLFDASLPRLDRAQARSVRTYLDRVWNELEFNTKLNVFSTEGDVLASVFRPRFHVCGQTENPEELKAINADSGASGYLKRQKERLYEKVLAPELDGLLAVDGISETRLQLNQSPVLESLRSLSLDYLKRGDRLIVVSDMIHNTESARFCSVKGHMPAFNVFRERGDYRTRFEPQSFEGIHVDVLMLQRSGFGQEDGLPYCESEEELMRFWNAYFEHHGAERVAIRRVRMGD